MLVVYWCPFAKRYKIQQKVLGPHKHTVFFYKAVFIREDTHKKSVFFSGRTAKSPPPTTKQKTTFFL